MMTTRKSGSSRPEYPFECEKAMVDFDVKEMSNLISCVLYDIYDSFVGLEISGDLITIDGKYRLERYPSGRYKVFIVGQSRWISVMSLNGTRSIKGCLPEQVLTYLLQQYMEKGFNLWMERNYLAGA